MLHLAQKYNCGIVALFNNTFHFYYMSDKFEKAKTDVLSHIESILEEIEQEIALSHQEKYALLEDAFGSASDVDELRVAFDQWFMEHSDDIGFDHDADELWDQALGGEHSFFSSEDDALDEFDDDDVGEDEEDDMDDMDDDLE